MKSAETEAARRADAAARDAAQTVFDRPLVLEAGAGTGKTATLVARILAWSLGPGWERASRSLASGAEVERIAARVLDGVVAITFTEAAAAEMAEKTALALAALAAGDRPTGLGKTVIADIGERERLRSRALLANLDHLVVRTIHAFCRRLLAAYPLEAGIDPRFEVDADGRAAAEVVFEVIDAKLAEAYGEPGDPAWLALAQLEVGPEEIRAVLAALLDARLPAEALDADPFTAEAVAAARTRLVALIDALLAADGGGLDRGKRVSSAQETLAALRQARAEASRLEGGGVAVVRALADIAAAAVAASLARLKKWAKADYTKSEAAALAEAAAGVSTTAWSLIPALAHAAALDPERLDHLRRALRPLLDEATRRLRAGGVVNFAGLLVGVRDLLERDSAARERIRRGIDQLLVDEFQDTDPVQCAIMARLALDGGEERPGLFVVGDPKQSIYGWRSADLGAYEGFLAEVRRAGGDVHSLTVNFRSVPAILEEVKRVVWPVMSFEAGVQPKFEPLLPSEKRANERGFESGRWAPVEHWISCARDAESGLPCDTSSARAVAIEAAAVAADIAALHGQGVAWGAIGILMRSRGELEDYLGKLRDAGVPYAVGKDVSYYRRREVIEAAALVPLWMGAFPTHMTELRAPSDPLLATICTLVRAVAANPPPDVPGLERVAGWEHAAVDALTALAELRASFVSDPADVFVERLRRRTLVESTEAARYLGRYRIANLDRFFREVEVGLEESAGDAPRLLRELRRAVEEEREAHEARPRESAEDAVQVLTIHQAKGLDFDHVYLVQAHKGSPRGDDRKATGVAEVEGKVEYTLAGAATLGYDRVDEARRRTAAAERVRTLYVALTRARDRLVVVGNWDPAKAPVEPESAGSHADLLLSRGDTAPALAAIAAAPGQPPFIDQDGARWVLPGFADLAAGERESASTTVELPTPAAVERVVADLERKRAAAEIRMARTWSAPAAKEAHEALREQLADAAGDEGGEVEARSTAPLSADRALAMAVGSAIHRALESFDLVAPLASEVERQRGLLESYLKALVAAESLPAAATRAEELWSRIAGGKLLARLVALAPHIVARELPVLLAPGAGDDAPVGYVAGAIDLVYREPATGALVVVDYKTDEVANDAEIAERSKAYALQGAVYVRAVHEALGLSSPPRFELWYLAADRLAPQLP